MGCKEVPTVLALAETIDHVVLKNIRWSTYEELLKDVGDRSIRLTYDRGTLEIMSPSHRHDWYARLIDRMICVLTEEREVPIKSAGSTTWRSALQGRGLEADDSYYVQNEPSVRGKADFDPDTDPFPDLAVEVEISRSVLDRLGIYAAIGIGEIWTFDGANLRAMALVGEEYQPIETSRAFPFLEVADLSPWLHRAGQMDETTWIRTFREWVRQTLCTR